MLKSNATISAKTVNKTETVELKGWIDARFENMSKLNVFIFNREYEPGEIFFAGVADRPVFGNVEVRFAPGETKPLVLVTFGVEKDCN